ncbi:MAG: neutral/alkaline non-lysosomal ceramidase N-terminal domain-containing protein, partial [Actinomycetota bacterium]
DKDPDNVVNSVSGGDVDPHGHSIAQRDSYGVQSRLSYRAIVVEDSAGDRVAFVKSDSYLAQDYLLRRAAQWLLTNGSEITYEDIFHMASHNHSSPYYMTPSAGVWIFQDAFDIRAFEYHARAMAEAIMNAEAALKPARMGATTVKHKLFKGVIQRKGESDDGTPRGYPDDFGDLGLSVLRFDNVEVSGDPKPLATLINWGQHPESLDGHDLITGDYVASLERFVERETHAPLVFGQGDVGSAEAGPGHPELVRDLGIPARWSHVGHAQAERGGYLLAQDVIKAYDEIGNGDPIVPFDADFDVAAGNAFVAGPYSHPYPSVSNCRTETTVEGSPATPGPPECIRVGEPDKENGFWEDLKKAGLPLPDNYDLPSYAGLEENTRLKLQAFKLGDVVIASCACEAQVDLILNFESRANNVIGDQWDGFDWTTRMDCDDFVQDENTFWTCTKKPDDPRPNAVQAPFTVSDYRYQRMLAQIHNPADGWDAPENIHKALSEPYEPADIFGNFTTEELDEETGYKLAIGVGHAGDYNGYTVSYREYQSWDDYRKSLTSYGPHTADYMVTRMVRLAGTLNGKESLELQADVARGLPDEGRMLAASSALGGAAMAVYEAWTNALPVDSVPEEQIVTQPKDIRRFDAATLSWYGGSNAIDNPTVVVERKVDGDWRFFADQSGEIQTKLQFPQGVNALGDTYTGRQSWKWTANFEAFDAFPAGIGSTPEGEYRFVVDGKYRSQPTSNADYHRVSDPFTVSAWDGIVVNDLGVEEDGSVSFTPRSNYPTTYSSEFRYVTEDSNKTDAFGKTFCTQCSFRPWATSGEIVEATVTIVRAGEASKGGSSNGSAGTVSTVQAQLGADGRWYASAGLRPPDAAVILPGAIVDSYGETNTDCFGDPVICASLTSSMATKPI